MIPAPISRKISFAAIFLAVSFVLATGCGDDDKTPSEPNYVKDPVRVTRTGGIYPTSSPDGLRLAYFLPTVGLKLLNIPMDSSYLIQSFGGDPDWAPRGNLVAIRWFDDNYNPPYFIGTVDVSSGDTAIIRTDPRRFYSPAWSPDMNEILAYDEDSGMVIISYPDGDIIYFNDLRPSLTDFMCYDPDWSPGGEWIVFGDTSGIFKTRRDYDTIVPLYTGQPVSYHYAWSPNGQWIAFARWDSLNDNACLWVIDHRGSNYGLWQLTSLDDVSQSDCYAYGIGCWDNHPTWSPDSKTIYFASNRQDRLEIWKVEFRP